MNTLTHTETESILTICLMAAFADGDKSKMEREQISKITATFGESDIDLPALYQKVLIQQPALHTITETLTSPGVKKLAYEMAVCVVEADNIKPESEKAFLSDLRAALQLDATATGELESKVGTLALVPPPTDSAEASDDTKAMILRYSICAGAMELLPQTVATLAIIPLQTKMVYRLAKQNGYELNRSRIGEFLATVGLGLASQVFEGFARRLTRQLGKKVAGKWGGKISEAATGPVLAFATTYALGTLAHQYYSRGRTLPVESMKTRFAELVEEGKETAARYSEQIRQQYNSFSGSDLTSIMRTAP